MKWKMTFELPYETTIFVVADTGNVGITKSFDGDTEIEDIDFKVNDKTMEIVNFQKTTYGERMTLFDVSKFESGYISHIYLEPHGNMLMGTGNTISEALEEASEQAIKFWKEWEDMVNGAEYYENTKLKNGLCFVD
jgi:hypothetical protein